MRIDDANPDSGPFRRYLILRSAMLSRTVTWVPPAILSLGRPYASVYQPAGASQNLGEVAPSDGRESTGESVSRPSIFLAFKR